MTKQTAIPASITADLSGLEIGDSARLSTATLPAGVKPVIQDRDFVLATIAAPSELGEDAQEPAVADPVPEEPTNTSED